MAMTATDERERIIARAKTAAKLRRRRPKARNINRELPPKPKPAKKVRPKQELPKKKVAVKNKGGTPRPSERAIERASGNAKFKRLSGPEAMRAKEMIDRVRGMARGSGAPHEVPKGAPPHKGSGMTVPPFSPPVRKKPPVGSGMTVPPFAPPVPVRPPSTTRPVPGPGPMPVVGTPRGGSAILTPKPMSSGGPGSKIRNSAGAPKPRVKMGSRIGSGGRSS